MASSFSTPRKGGASRLFRRARSLWLLLDHAPNEIFVIEAESLCLLFVNRYARRNLGYTLEELQHMTVLDISPDYTQEALHPLMARLRAGQLKNNLFETRRKRKDGTLYPAELSIQLFEIAGQVLWISIGRDISDRKAFDRMLAETTQRYQSLFDNHPDPVISFDLAGHVTSANHAAGQFYGFSLEELLGLHYSLLTAPDDQDRVRYHFDLAAAGKAQQYECRVLRKDGTTGYFDFTEVPIRTEGEIVGVYGIGRDITQRKEAEQALAESEERFKLLAQTTNDVVWDWDIATGVFHWNEGIYTVFGYSDHQVPADITQWQQHVHPEDRSRVMAGLNHTVLGSGYYWTDDYRYLKGDGSYAYIHNRGSILRTPEGTPVRMIGALVDMTPVKRTEERLTYLAQNDALTGLANRSLFYDHLHLAVNRAARSSRQVALMFLDLDRFKEVNDELGHDVGDEVLKEVAKRLKQCLRETDLVSRLGGDEFTIIIEDVVDVESVAHVAEKIVEAVSSPIHASRHEVFVSTSIGISLYPTDAVRIEDLTKQADSAMYHAKRQGRNHYQFYAGALNARAGERLEIETHLRQAVSRNELELYYQPMVELRTRRIAGVEALLRWNSPALGFMLPERFLPLAEETGMMLQLGEWVLRTACRQQQLWRAAGLPGLRMAVNLSARQLKQAAFVDSVAQILHETGLPPSCLDLEITEAALIEDREDSRRLFEQLKRLGVGLSIDDFGTGYSSLQYLMTFPLDTLKIDQSFVRRLPDSVTEAAIASAIITMAHNLGLKVIAEGIETAQQMAFLAGHACDFGQGFFFSGPQAAPGIPPLLAGR